MRRRVVSPHQTSGHGQGTGADADRCSLISPACSWVTRQPASSSLHFFLSSPCASMENNFIQILEEHPVNQNTAGCQRSQSRTVLSHTTALSILLLHSLDRDINKKRKQAITVTKALTAQGKWHVNSASGRLKLAGNNHAPLTHSNPFSPLCGWVCLLWSRAHISVHFYPPE